MESISYRHECSHGGTHVGSLENECLAEYEQSLHNES